MKRNLLFAVVLLLLVLATSASADAPVPAPVPLEQTTYFWSEDPSLPILKAGDTADFRSTLARCAVVSRKATYKSAAVKKAVNRTTIGAYCWMKTADGLPIPDSPIIYLESFYDGNAQGSEWVAGGVLWWSGDTYLDFGSSRSQRWEYLFQKKRDVLRIKGKEYPIWGLKKQKWPVALTAPKLTEKQRVGVPTILSIRSNKPRGSQGTEVLAFPGSRLVCANDFLGALGSATCFLNSPVGVRRRSTLVLDLFPPWSAESWQLRIFYIPPDRQVILAGWRP